MAKVVWTDSAIKDLDEIGEYIAKDSQRYAQLVVEKLFFSVDFLETNLYAGKQVMELGDEKIRELIKKNYRIVYHIVSKDQVDILTIHRTERLRGNAYDFSEIDDQ